MPAKEEHGNQRTMRRKKEAFIATYSKKACIVRDACKAAGVARRTYQIWRKEDEEFDKALWELEQELLDVAESELYKAAKTGKAWAICFLLKCKGKDRGWIESVRQEITGADGGPVTFRVIYEQPKVGAEDGN